MNFKTENSSKLKKLCCVFLSVNQDINQNLIGVNKNISGGHIRSLNQVISRRYNTLSLFAPLCTVMNNAEYDLRIGVVLIVKDSLTDSDGQLNGVKDNIDNFMI